MYSCVCVCAKRLCLFAANKIMSDSDDDWFDKDIDEFVVQSQPSDVEHISVANAADADNPAIASEYIDAGLFCLNYQFQ